jgi:hypothetical protein
MLENFWVAERLAASREGLSPMKSVYTVSGCNLRHYQQHRATWLTSMREMPSSSHGRNTEHRDWCLGCFLRPARQMPSQYCYVTITILDITTGRCIISRIVIVILIYHWYKPIHLIYTTNTIMVWYVAVFKHIAYLARTERGQTSTVTPCSQPLRQPWPH